MTKTWMINDYFAAFGKRLDLLNFCLDGSLDDLLIRLDGIEVNLEENNDEKQDLQLLRYILTDYHANCSKPPYVLMPNERTPFAEYIIPIFKYFSASSKLLSFIWEVDGDHTKEDTLKLIEYTSNCLKHEINQYQYASWTTFGRRRILVIQCIRDKLTLLSTSRMGVKKLSFIEVRSAIVTRDWEDRYYLKRIMELLMKQNEMLLEQEELIMILKQQQSGRLPVDANDTIKKVTSLSRDDN